MKFGIKEKASSPITGEATLERMTIKIPKDMVEFMKLLAQKKGISLNAYLLLLIYKSIFP